MGGGRRGALHADGSWCRRRSQDARGQWVQRVGAARAWRRWCCLRDAGGVACVCTTPLSGCRGSAWHSFAPSRFGRYRCLYGTMRQIGCRACGRDCATEGGRSSRRRRRSSKRVRRGRLVGVGPGRTMSLAVIKLQPTVCSRRSTHPRWHGRVLGGRGRKGGQCVHGAGGVCSEVHSLPRPTRAPRPLTVVAQPHFRCGHGTGAAAARQRRGGGRDGSSPKLSAVSCVHGQAWAVRRHRRLRVGVPQLLHVITGVLVWLGPVAHRPLGAAPACAVELRIAEGRRRRGRGGCQRARP